MAVTKAAILTVTNPRSPASQRATGTVQSAYPRYQNPSNSTDSHTTSGI